jgi:hypothetical protein
MPITINGNGTITGASTLATAIASPTFTTPNIDSAQFATVSGTAPIYACRAWVNFNGTSTVAIRASGNVSSITDNGTGDYTVNFTTAMPDANYSIVGASGGANSTSNGAVYLADQVTARTTSLFRTYAITPAGGLADTPQMNAAVFR